MLSSRKSLHSSLKYHTLIIGLVLVEAATRKKDDRR